MEFNSSKYENGLVLRAKGRMDAVTAPEFEQEANKWIEQDEKKLAVNLEGLEYISSAGLRSILATGKKLKAQGGSLVFCCLAGMVKEVFDISGFASIFPVFDSEDKALKSMDKM